MPFYHFTRNEVMRHHNISEEEYDKRTLEGDRAIYLPQPNNKFEATDYMERVAHVLGLDYQELQDRFKSGALKHLIACGPNNPETGGWDMRTPRYSRSNSGCNKCIHCHRSILLSGCNK